MILFEHPFHVCRVRALSARCGGLKTRLGVDLRVKISFLYGLLSVGTLKLQLKQHSSSQQQSPLQQPAEHRPGHDVAAGRFHSAAERRGERKGKNVAL